MTLILQIPLFNLILQLYSQDIVKRSHLSSSPGEFFVLIKSCVASMSKASVKVKPLQNFVKNTGIVLHRMEQSLGSYIDCNIIHSSIHPFILPILLHSCCYLECRTQKIPCQVCVTSRCRLDFHFSCNGGIFLC